MRAELHGHPQPAGTRDDLQAERDGPGRHRRQCRHHFAKWLGGHRHGVRLAPFRHQPLRLRRQRGGDAHRRLHRIPDRRSPHQGDRDIHRNRARAGALRRRARPRRRCRQARRRAQGRPHRAHAARHYQSHRRARRRIARVLRTAARAPRHRGQRSRRDDRGARRLPGQSLAARPRHFRHHRLRRTGRNDSRRWRPRRTSICRR